MFVKDGPRLATAGFIPWLFQGFIFPYAHGWDGDFYDEGKQLITANDPKIVAACEWLTSYAKNYDIATIESFSQEFGKEAQDPFIMGQLGMVLDGPWRIASSQERYGPDMQYRIAPMAIPEGSAGASTYTGGWSVVIPRGAPEVETGWKFINYFTNEAGQIKFFLDTSKLPSLVKAAQDPRIGEGKYSVFSSLLPVARNRPPLPVGQFLWNALQEARDLMVHQVKTPQEALDDVTVRTNEEMKKYVE